MGVSIFNIYRRPTGADDGGRSHPEKRQETAGETQMTDNPAGDPGGDRRACATGLSRQGVPTLSPKGQQSPLQVCHASRTPGPQGGTFSFT